MIIDSSGNNHIITRHGDKRLRSLMSGRMFMGASGVGGDDETAYSFTRDGTDRLTIPSHSDWDFGTGDWTVDFWMRTIDSATTNELTIGCGTALGTSDWVLYINKSSFGAVFDDWGVNERLGSAPANWVDLAWMHIAIVRDSDTMRYFINGVSQGTSALSTSYSIPNNSYELRIGNLDFSSWSDDWGGYLDELRISNTARWTSGFTVPTTRHASDSNTKLLIHGNEAYTGALTDEATQSCYAFDGAADYLSVVDSSDWAFGTSDFTFEAWMKFDGMGAWYYLFTQWADSSNLMYMAKENTDKFSMYFEDSGGLVGSYLTTSAWSGNVGQWYHIAFQRRNGASPEGELYIDGVSQALTEDTAFGSNDWADISAPLLIGERSDGGGAEFTGTMAEVRVSNIARYTGNFTPETERYTSDSNTKLLIHGDETKTGTTGSGATFTDSGNTGHTVTESGNAVVENGGTFTDSGNTGHTVTENGNTRRVGNEPLSGITGDQSWYSFDGTGDYLSVADSNDWDLVGSSSQDYTVDLWVKFTDHYSQEFIIGQWAGTNTFWWIEHDSGGGFNFMCLDSSVTVITAGARAGEVTDTDWHHLALCKVTSGGPTVEWGIYLDGSQVYYASDADTVTFAGSLYLGVRGDGSSNPFDGKMTEVRITNTNSFSASPVVGTTDTITVPTERYTSDSNTLLLIHGDESKTGTTGSGATFTDSGNTGHTVTENGNAKAFEDKFYKF